MKIIKPVTNLGFLRNKRIEWIAQACATLAVATKMLFYY
jgi:hypothetical protein